MNFDAELIKIANNISLKDLGIEEDLEESKKKKKKSSDIIFPNAAGSISMFNHHNKTDGYLSGTIKAQPVMQADTIAAHSPDGASSVDCCSMGESLDLTESSMTLESDYFEDGYYLECRWDKVAGYEVIGGYSNNEIIQSDYRKSYPSKEAALNAYKKLCSKHSTKKDITLTETKRYVRRYFMRPQNIPLSNKAEVLKALIDHEDEDCIIYTLNNLGDIKDFNKLTDDDVIYYYDDGILYDKNHVRIMDYDLSIKHEEEREKINPDTTSDAKFADVYADRMTDATDLEEEIATEAYPNIPFDSDNKVGDKIRINHLEGEDASYDGKVGIIDHIDDLGQLHGTWGGLAIIPGVDDYDTINESLIVEEATKPTFYKFGLDQQTRELLRNKANIEAHDVINKVKAGQVNLSEQSKKYFSIVKNMSWTDGDRYLKYYKQYYNWYIEQSGIKTIEHRAVKTAATYTALKELDPTEAKEAADWLETNVASIKFAIPKADNVDDIINRLSQTWSGKAEDLDKKAYKLQTTFINYFEEFKNKFPNAKKGIDYTFRDAASTTDTDPRCDLWGMSGTITFKVNFEQAPNSVIKMFEKATEISRSKNHAVKTFDEIKSGKNINNYYFCLAVLKLFNNNLDFYKTNKFNDEPSANDAFNLTFENLCEDADDNICCICGEHINGYGNNAEPYKSGRCCDACNIKFVIPARLSAINKD